jgi:RNA recognition motif-containing protein
MNIFVGNLGFSATEQDIRQLFERYGVVDTVRIMTDRETGRPRGFGFVEMSDETAARGYHWTARRCSWGTDLKCQ